MIIQISIAELRTRGEILFANWEKDKQEMKINAKQLYRIIKLKAIIEEELKKAQTAINVIAEQNGGELQPEGGYKIPSDKIPIVNAQLADIAAEMIDIEYIPIQLKEDDVIPADIMDALFPFIEME